MNIKNCHCWVCTQEASITGEKSHTWEGWRLSILMMTRSRWTFCPKCPTQYLVICLSLTHQWHLILHLFIFKPSSFPFPIVFSGCKIYLLFYWKHSNSLKGNFFTVKWAGLEIHPIPPYFRLHSFWWGRALSPLTLEVWSACPVTSLVPLLPPSFSLYHQSPYWTML